MNRSSHLSPLLSFSLWALLLLIAVAAPQPLFAQSGSSLDDVLVDLGPATEDEIRIIAAGQANDQAGPKYPSVAVERRTFIGLFTPASATTQLAIFSDDGCDIYIDGTKMHNRLDQGQALPDLGASFHLLTPPQPWEVGRSYPLRVEYSNTFYQGLTDIDGATLFAFNGGGSVLPVTVDRVIVDGSSPEDLGPGLLCTGSSLTLRAIPAPSAATFATGSPVWSLVEKPSGSTLVVNGTGDTQAFTPDVTGKFAVKATAGGTSDTFEIYVPRLTSLTITESKVDSSGTPSGTSNQIT